MRHYRETLVVILIVLCACVTVYTWGVGYQSRQRNALSSGARFAVHYARRDENLVS